MDRRIDVFVGLCLLCESLRMVGLCAAYSCSPESLIVLTIAHRQLKELKASNILLGQELMVQQVSLLTLEYGGYCYEKNTITHISILREDLMK